MIIFNQHEQYENLIKNGFEKYPNFRDLMILAKEWKFVENMEPKDIKTRLIGFCNSKVDNFDEAKSQELIKNVIEKLKKTQNYTELPLKLVFFKGELDQILQVVNKEWRKIIFIFCCLCKLKRSNGIYLNSSNTIKLSDIFDLCGIKKTKKAQEHTLFELNKAGYLDVSLKPLLKYTPFCLLEDGEVDFEVEPSPNLILELQKRDNPTYLTCEKCGKSFLKTSNRAKYCKECGVEIHREKARERKRAVSFQKSCANCTKINT